MAQIEQEKRVMHPEAVIPSIARPEETLRDMLGEAQRLSDQQEKQLRQYRELLEQATGEVKQLRKEMKFWEPHKDLKDDTRKTHMCYLRDPIVIERLKVVARMTYGKLANVRADGKEDRSMASRLVDGIVEVCVREGIRKGRWHITQQKLEEIENATRPRA